MKIIIFIHRMRIKLTLLLAVCCLGIFAHPAKGQDSALAALSHPSPIVVDGACRSFAVGGQSISYDSCKKLLLAFPSSAKELIKVIRMENRIQIATPVAGVLAVPTFAFTTADELTSFNTHWVDATTGILCVAFVGDMAVLLGSEAAKRKHLRRAIGLYNAEIKKM
jgi:hypothetical protein